MSAEEKTGGPAFPSGDGEWGGGPNHAYGMTLRDYFAAQALPAVIAATSAGQHNIHSRKPGKPVDATIQFAIAFDAYELADAMIAARSEP